MNSGGENLGVVDNKKITRLKKVDETRHVPVLGRRRSPVHEES